MNGGDFGFTNQDARGDVDGEAGNDGKCHNCGGGKLQIRHHHRLANSAIEGHMARDCEEPRKMGACFNCGEEGHSKVDCVKPRVFTGECNDCGEKGSYFHPGPSYPCSPLPQVIKRATVPRSPRTAATASKKDTGHSSARTQRLSTTPMFLTRPRMKPGQC